MTRKDSVQRGPALASPRHYAIAMELHKSKAAPLHRHTAELLLALCTDELDEARAMLEELMPLREHAARLEQENYWLIDQLTKTVAALERADSEKNAVRAERAQLEQDKAKWARELQRLEGESRFWQKSYKNSTKQTVWKPAGSVLARPYAPMIEEPPMKRPANPKLPYNNPYNKEVVHADDRRNAYGLEGASRAPVRGLVSESPVRVVDRRQNVHVEKVTNAAAEAAGAVAAAAPPPPPPPLVSVFSRV